MNIWLVVRLSYRIISISITYSILLFILLSAHFLANFDVEIILPTCTCNHWNNLEEGDTINCHYQATGSQRITITCPPNTKGRYVRIKRRDSVYLNICEIEVYGNPVNSLHESGIIIDLIHNYTYFKHEPLEVCTCPMTSLNKKSE